LQNPALEKDLTIAVIDGARGVGNGEVIPAGPLRAPIEFQLGLVDCIVVNGGQAEDRSRESAILERLRRGFPGPVLAAHVGPTGDVGWLKGLPAIAYAGIGHPIRFFDLLEDLGAHLDAKSAFPDHHVLSEAEAEDLLRASSTGGAQLVTTEKDWVRLKGLGGRRAELQTQSRALPVRLMFDERDQGRLVALIDAAAKTGGRRKAQLQR
jgi:tetraacyldisaccharide 4'-kinase